VITDGEVNRAVNAVATTLRDQRPGRFEPERVQAIVDGALGGERKLTVRRHDDASGELVGPDGRQVAVVTLRGGVWTATRG